MRDSDNVVTYAGHNLQQLAAFLPEEERKIAILATAQSCCQLMHSWLLPTCAVWAVYEQVAIAALDSRAVELAISLIQKIRKKFPKSSRTYRLTVSPTSVSSRAGQMSNVSAACVLAVLLQGFKQSGHTCSDTDYVHAVDVPRSLRRQCEAAGVSETNT